MLRHFRRNLPNPWPVHPRKKFPLKDNPLRNPGQSLDEAIQRLMDEDVSVLIAVMMLCLVTAGYEWWRWYANVPYHPVYTTLFGGGIATYCVFRLYRLKQQLKTLKLARDGEKAVGQYLERLREKGYRIFHDVIGDHFNLDHVIIGSQGIFTIETKTFSKPIKGKANIYFDGKAITINGNTPERNPITQAQAQAHWLSEQITASTGQTHPIKPVVVFPGWFVTSSSQAKSSNVWVINLKGLPKFLEHAPNRLNPETVQLIAYHLSRYVRTQAQTDRKS
ncbi:MAG: nuclease-related domain-containing protein [Cyanobacteria bacterium J06631_9]